jgi:uncharacterized repeat protein (TIGR02543 family)
MVQKYTVTINTNGGNSITAQIIEHGKKVINPDHPTKSGHTFSGWYTDATLETAYDFESAVKGNITIYARW